MINKIEIYDSNNVCQHTEELGAKGTNITINVNGIQSTNVNDAIGELNDKIGDVNSSFSTLHVADIGELYIGELVQGRVGSDGKLVEDSTSLVTRSLLSLPQKGLTLTVHIASGYKVALVYGIGSGTALPASGDYVTDGGTIATPSAALYYKAVVKKTNDSDSISASDIPELGLYITYKVTQEMWPIAAYANNQIALVKEASNNGKLPLISHISDVHSDSVRTKRMLDFSDFIGVVCACITGDNTNDKPENGGVYWLGDCCSKAKSNVMVCGGNHDTTTVGGAHDTQKSTLNEIINVAENKFGRRTNLNYYFDIPHAKLRIITFDQPFSGGYTAVIEDFVCDAMLGTPAGFGVILMYHIPETWIKGSLAEGVDTTFYDGGFTSSQDWFSQYGKMSQKIADAFIAGGTYSKTETLGATVDFSQKASGVKFVAHMTGHIHNDNILNLQDASLHTGNESNPTHRQVMLNVGSGNVGLGAVKSISNYTQDAFNVYAIDLENEVINVVRIGWDKGGTRKSMTISFAQTQ